MINIKDTIENSYEVRNYPDEVYFNGAIYTYDGETYKKDDNAEIIDNYQRVPFVILYGGFQGKVIFYGGDEEIHSDIERRIMLSLQKKYSVQKLMDLFPSVNFEEQIMDIWNLRKQYLKDCYSDTNIIKRLNYYLNENDKYSEEYELQKMFNELVAIDVVDDIDLFCEIFSHGVDYQTGRSYIFNVNNEIYTIIAIWNAVDNQEMVNNSIKTYLNDNLYNVQNSNTILIANGRKPYIVYKSDNNVNIDNNKEAYIAHLDKNQERKRQFFQNFRQAKERKLADKLVTKDDDGNFKSEMPLAQYNALKYVDENKTNKKIYLTEKQFKELMKQ